MAITNVPGWFTVAASNIDLNSVALDPAVMVASQLPPTFQQVMSQIASFTRRGADTATAGTLNLDTTPNEFMDLTGTTTVTAVTLTATHGRMARAAGVFTLTASATLIVNGSTSVNYTTTANDLLFFQGYAAATVRVWVFASASVTVPTATTTADIWTGTATGKYSSPAIMQAALAEVALSDAATVTVDFSTGINFKLDTIGGNRALAASNLTNVIGRSGRIRVKQDATGSRTLNITASPFVTTNGVDFVLSTAASATDVIYYDIVSATQVVLSNVRAIS